MEWFIAAVIVVALGVAAAVAAGRMGEMGAEPVRDYYRQDLPEDRPLTAAEVEGVRFGVTLRGYSMAQVDDLVERLVGEIAARDAELTTLRDRVGPPASTPAAPAPVAPGAYAPPSVHPAAGPPGGPGSGSGSGSA